MTNLLTIVAVALIVQMMVCLKIKVSMVPKNRNATRYQVVKPLPCYEFFAYCQQPYNISRSNMTRMEGDRRAGLRPPQKISWNDFVDHRCFCDPNCRQYGDCCLDKLTDMKQFFSLQEFEKVIMTNHTKGLREWECVPHPVTGINVYMIGSCPSNYTNSIILSRCRRQVPSPEYDYALDLPVLSQPSHLTYANVYCAICNNDKQVYHWNITINCPPNYPNCTKDIDGWRYSPGMKMWQYQSSENGTGTSYNVTYYIEDSKNNDTCQNFEVRQCRPDVVSNCPAGWLSNREKLLCQSYSLLVKSRNTSRLYKNEYCAICHGERADRMQCPRTVIEQPVVKTKPPPGFHSYALLLDFMGQGNQVGEAGRCGSEGLVCGFGELCDTLHNRCRVYTCGRKYRMQDNGKCVLTNDTSMEGVISKSSDLPFLDSDCPKFYVSRERFIRYHNNSVYIKAIKKLYNSSQYEVVNATTILVCTSHDSTLTWKFSVAQSILSRVCITLSLICLAAHVIINVLTPPLLNLPGKNLLCLSMALFVAQMSFEYGVGASSPHQLCVGIGLITHFGFLSAFLWMNVMAVDIFRTFGSDTRTRSPLKGGCKWEFRVYSIYAWLLSLTIVLAAFTNDIIHYMPGFEPMYGSPLCWFNNRQGLLIFFALPLACLLLVNVVFFSLTVKAICQTKNKTKIARRNLTSTDAKERSRMLLYIKLALIMGLTWILGFVAAFANLEVFWYLFIILNCLQGTFIFISFSCKKNVLKMLQRSKCHNSACNGAPASSKSKNLSDSQTRPSFRTIITSVSKKLNSFDGPK